MVVSTQLISFQRNQRPLCFWLPRERRPLYSKAQSLPMVRSFPSVLSIRVTSILPLPATASCSQTDTDSEAAGGKRPPYITIVLHWLWQLRLLNIKTYSKFLTEESRETTAAAASLAAAGAHMKIHPQRKARLGGAGSSEALQARPLIRSVPNKQQHAAAINPTTAVTLL